MDVEFEAKIQTWGTLFILFGCFQCVTFIAAFMAFGMAAAGTFAALRADDPILKWYTIMGVWGIITMPLTLLLFIFALIAGIGLKKRKPYGRIWGIIAAAVALLEFPVGTLFAIFAVRFFANDRSK